MQVTKIQQPQITFTGKVLDTRIVPNGGQCRSLYTDYRLNNGKNLRIIEQQIDGNTLSKLQYLTSYTGKWIKSKLKLYSNNKVYKTLISLNKEI